VLVVVEATAVAVVVEAVESGLAVVIGRQSGSHPSTPSYVGASPLHAGPIASSAASTPRVEPMLPVRTRLELRIGIVRRPSCFGACTKGADPSETQFSATAIAARTTVLVSGFGRELNQLSPLRVEHQEMIGAWDRG
jgi:hypothetical protein